MNLHPAEIGREVSPGAHAVLVLDGAGRHRMGRRLRVPADTTLLHPPPCAPEPDPAENIRAYSRGDSLGNRVFDSCDAILDARCEARDWLMSQPGRTTATATGPWAQVRQ